MREQITRLPRPAVVRRLAQASAFELGYPHEMLGRALTRTVMFGSAKVIGLNDR